jgi:outer membrane lipoprotein-sorting protein
MNRLISIAEYSALLVLVTVLTAFSAKDPFDQIKKEFRKAACSEIEFISVLESKVFDEVDSTNGLMYLADNGRYWLEIGPDQYLMTHSELYSFSGENNQVTIEQVDTSAQGPSEISLLRRLDELYETHIITPGREYRLIRKSKDSDNLPDTMLVYLDAAGKRLDRLEYKDINGDQNRILIQEYRYQKDCNEKRFEPNFPESAERIKLN